MKPDLILACHGSIYLLLPVTASAKDWVDTNIQPDCLRHGRAVAIEPRYITDVVHGAQCDGLSVEVE